MYFNSLKEKCEYYRSLVDYKLLPNSYVIVMLDGHRFSKMIKKKFQLPFDDKFIDMMNKTAEYVCQNVQGAKFAFTQSDEISILITDFDTEVTDSYFGYRLCKLQSIIASLATGYFNKLLLRNNCDCPCSSEDMLEMIDDFNPVQFDCKAWTVPNANDAYAWFLYRQIDCIKNSKNQTARTYLSHKSLIKLTADDAIQKLKDEKGIDWNEFDNGKKHGRLIKKVELPFTKEINGQTIYFNRNVWTPVGCTDFKEDNTLIKSLIEDITK